MRAHSLRRTIWMANVLLGAGVLAVGAYGFTQVRPVLSDAARAKPKWASDAVDRYRKLDDPRSIQVAPVSLQMLEEVDKPEYRTLHYWIYSGPVPPAPTVATEAPVVQQPKGLEALGKPASVLYLPPEQAGKPSKSVVIWLYTPSNKKGYHAVGEWIGEGEPKRFKLVDVVRPVAGVSKFKLLYDVYDDPKGSPVQTAQEYLWDNSKPRESKIVRELKPAAGAGAGGTAAPAAGAAAPGVAPAGATPDAGTRETAVVEPSLPEPDVRDPAAEASPATVKKINSSTYEVTFDDPVAYDRWKGKKVEDIAETIQTEETKGGVKITGLQPGTPAEWFGVKPGDKLISINNQPASTRSDVIRIAQGMPQDTALVTVVIDRNGKRITFNVDPRDPKVRRNARYLDGK